MIMLYVDNFNTIIIKHKIFSMYLILNFHSCIIIVYYVLFVLVLCLDYMFLYTATLRIAELDMQYV